MLLATVQAGLGVFVCNFFSAVALLCCGSAGGLALCCNTLPSLDIQAAEELPVWLWAIPWTPSRLVCKPDRDMEIHSTAFLLCTEMSRNTQRLLGQLRHGDASHAPALVDVALASTVAGFISVGIGTPVDLVKIRLQMQTQTYSTANVKLKPTVPGFPVYQGPIHCFRTVLQKEGIAGIYRGMGAMLLRDVPGYCLYFIPYTFFCGWITPDGSISPNPASIWLAGGVAGAISWGTATPMDVVKSRLQADGVYLNKYKGILDCILQSYQNEGLKVFFRGITINAVRGFPTSSAMFLGYELSLKAMKRDQTETNP
eukprot:XP_025010699.1 solute carrier family 25 member 48 isoform X1 [Gallus gallus]